MLISLEIDKNLEILSELWEKVNKIDPDEDDNQINKAYNLVNSSLRPWKNESWKSQISFLPIALNKYEIMDIHNFYDHLDNIESIHSSLLSLKVADNETRSEMVMSRPDIKHRGSLIEMPMEIVHPNYFKQDTPDL